MRPFFSYYLLPLISSTFPDPSIDRARDKSWKEKKKLATVFVNRNLTAFLSVRDAKRPGYPLAPAFQ